MKRFTFFLISCFGVLLSMAQVQPGDTAYNVSLHVGYAHNLTYGSYANFDIDAYMPVNQHFDMQANIRTSTGFGLLAIYHYQRCKQTRGWQSTIHLLS